jgi:hypothetical protein
METLETIVGGFRIGNRVCEEPNLLGSSVNRGNPPKASVGSSVYKGILPNRYALALNDYTMMMGENSIEKEEDRCR